MTDNAGANVRRTLELALSNGDYKVLLKDRMQVRLDNETRRPVLRATWYFQRSDGAMAPYDEDTAKRLEQTFVPVFAGGVAKTSADLIGQSVDVGEDRRVVYTGDVTFVQLRGDLTLGRKVWRGGYEHAMPRSSSREDLMVAVPAETRRLAQNPVREMAQGYVEGYVEGAEAARGMTAWMAGGVVAGEQVPGVHGLQQGPSADQSADEPTPPSQALAVGGDCQSGPTLRRSRGQELLRYAGLGTDGDLDALVASPADMETPLRGRGRWYWARHEGDARPVPEEASAALEVGLLRGVQMLQVTLDGRRMACLVQVWLRVCTA